MADLQYATASEPKKKGNFAGISVKATSEI